MKAIVTGGAGFIGSHLTERLIQDGHQVTVLDNLSTGRKENLKNLGSKVSFVKVDCSDLDRIVEHFKGADWVFHIAALADIVPSITEPHKYNRSNVAGTMAVLEASRLNGVKRFMYTASASCYGIPELFPTPETAAISPQYPYAFTKYIGEEYCLFWGKVYKMGVVSLRLFNVYGPRSRTSGTYGAVLGIFLAQKLAGMPFTVVGDGEQKRDFLYVSDVVDVFVKAANSDVSGEVFNVGSGDPQSVNALVKLLGSDKVVNIPKRPGEPDLTCADITKIKRILSWEPKVSLAEGIGKVLEKIDYWKNAPVWTPEKIEVATREWFDFLGK